MAHTTKKNWFTYFLLNNLCYQQVQIVEKSNTADHCLAFALSDPKEETFQNNCDHTHKKMSIMRRAKMYLESDRRLHKISSRKR